MTTRIDERILEVQQWLNKTYGQYVESGRFNLVNENGRTGWNTIYGLRRALQIELGIQETSDSFGPTTYAKCPTIAQGTENNMVYIVQGGLWCKGYNPGGFTGYYGNGTYAAVKQLKTDAGFPSASGNMQRDFIRALLDMSAFTCLPRGSEEIRSIQQELNYEYFDYYQICPCDGLYNRDMNKMLIYALQKEEGIPMDSATGTWGPTTISKCPTLTKGQTSPFVKLVRYALVCNGLNISTASATYDETLDAVASKFANSLLIPKPSNKIDYSVIKSLLSSNGDTNRPAKGCDTATKLSKVQIQTIKDNGYEIIGRYLTNTPGGTLDKCITETELSNILNEGLNIFLIFQENGRNSNNFNSNTGYDNSLKAFQAAEKLGVPHGSTIYFAVDFDPLDSQITSSIIPYFSAIKISAIGRKYRVGVYGTRNVCNRLKKELSIENFFVLDASYGFSGNLGFTMPEEWSFDQFKTDISIGTGAGQIDIDKVAVSGKDLGIKTTSSYIKNKVLDFAKGFDIDKKIDITANFEHDMVQVVEKYDNGNYISLKLSHGVIYNPDAGIKFSNEKELSAQIQNYLNDPVYDGVDQDTKTNIIASMNKLGFSIEKGNLEVSIMTVSDRYNSGVIVSYELTFPTTSDETSFSKVSIMFKYCGDVHIDFTNLVIKPEQAALFATLVIGIGCCVTAPALLPTLATGLGVSEGYTGLSGIITGIFKFFFA